ncbi:DUF3426 domain-containing protein [Ramlibacter sp. 2FC]|uniref:DUF3426 domain-containing protein n=1 Tax=Ramlibacter sp. 2FC TaxID=2502188 RepID=UPI0010F8CE22|nr:DUF3426 domain-containing protein [Ramlibacter sp. 2FC]
MSLITRCPACATMFKVVPDQLRMSEGWVRCGRCAEVFDASLSLQPVDAVAAPASSAPASPAPAASAPSASAMPLPGPAPASAPESPVVVPVVLSAASEAGNAVPRVAVAPVTREEWPPVDLPPEATLAEEAVFAQEALIGAMAQAARREAWAEETVEASSSLLRRADLDSEALEDSERMTLPPWAPEWAPTTVEPAPPELAFVRAARRQPFWRRRAPRALWASLVGALVLALGLQWALQQRDRLAAAQPRLKPWLAALCAPLGCRIGPPRQIDAVAIEGSSFSRLGADAFRLSLSLRNGAVTEVAMPSLELTLTDLQDQPVLRRVLHPADLGAPVALAASGEWSASTALAVDAQAGAPRVAGYRLIAFYP